MDNKAFGSNQQQSCEKPFVAIGNPSPFIRTMCFTSPTPLGDCCVRFSRVDSVATETPPNVSLTTSNLKDRCPRISKQSVAPAAADSRKQAVNKVALIQDHKGNFPHVSTPTINLAKPKANIIPISAPGQENGIPVIPYTDGKKLYLAESINGMSSEYIERAGKTIRSPTDVGVRKQSTVQDSFNDRVNDFINRTKYKFHNAPSFIEVSEGKEKKFI